MRDEEDLKWLIAREIPHLRRYAAVLADEPQRVDDLVQDCLERALRKRHLWSRQGNLRSWLFRLLYRQHIDAARGQSRRRRLTQAAGAELPRLQRPAQEPSVQMGDVVAALHLLPKDQQAAILLVGVEGFSYEEAAGILEVPVGTVRSRLSRGRDSLRANWAAPSKGAGEAAPRQAPALRRIK